MLEIMKHLENALQECSKRIAGIAKTEKEYDAKFKDLSDAGARLKTQGENLDAREKKVKHIENAVEYNERITADAEKIKKDGLELVRNQKALQAERAEFDKVKEVGEKKIKDGELRNQKQGDALVKERKEFEDKVRAYKGMRGAIE